MKISKLFHWLYAILMLLPAFFVGGRVLYTVFNKNAFESYYGETINEVQTINVGNNLIRSKQYYISVGYTSYQEQSEVVFSVSNVSGNLTNHNIINANKLIIRSQNNNTYLFFFNNSTYITDINFDVQNYYKVNFTFLDKTGSDLIQNYQTIFEDVPNKYSYLDNAFDYSMSQLNENSLFAWAKDSFLVEPFSYITGLFGIAAGNPINTLLSYWLSISIIWLVFDLVMYVPLLVHRWLDKGVLE